MKKDAELSPTFKGKAEPSESTCVGLCVSDFKPQDVIFFMPAGGKQLNSQAELFLPDWVQVAVDGLGSLLGLPHLDGDVRVAGACPVFGLETLSAHHW